MTAPRSAAAGRAIAQRPVGERAIQLAFFGSGAAGLIFEIVWFHRCELVFGSSVWSTSLVLSSFMGGLATGHALARAHGHRVRRLLWAYAVLELLVGISGIALTYLLPRVAPILAPAIRPLIDHASMANAVRFAASFLLLLVPATAMGATFPVLIPVVSAGGNAFGRALGQLYGWNTFGAVAGAVTAEALVVPQLGIRGAALIAGTLNLVAAAVAVILQLRAPTESRIAKPALQRSDRRPAARRMRAAAFLCGAVLLALEVVWFRFLSMFVLNSTLIMSLMLAVVLGGIGLGGLVASFWVARRPDADVYAPAVSLGAACLCVGSYVVFQPLTSGPSTASWLRVLWYTFVLTSGPSLLSGVLFTLIGVRLRRDIPDDIVAGGSLLVANTIGATLGPLVATFGLLPFLGMGRSFFVLAAAYCLVAAVVGRSGVVWAATAARVTAVACAAAFILLARFPFGLMTTTFFPRVAAAYSFDQSRIIATREGTAETILLMRQSWLGRSLYDRLVTNGFSMSGTHLTGKRYMRYFAYWPMVVRPDPIRHVLVVCYGVGVTTGAVTDISAVETIDVAEISRDIVAVSDLIYPANSRPLDDRRVRLYLEDGRQLLQVTRARYDLITGEPPPPLTPGVVNLYTREYFQLLYDHLADGGVATYWVPIAKDGEYDVAPIIRAFCDVFADCSLWNGTPFDWMLVGARGSRRRTTPAAFAAAWRDPGLGRHLREVGFEQPEQIGATFLGDAAFLRSLAARALPLTDDYPKRLLPTQAEPIMADPRSRVAFDRFVAVVDPARAREAFRRSSLIAQMWPQRLADDTLPWFSAQATINRIMLEGARPLRDIEELHRELTTTPLRRLPLWLLGTNDVIQDVADSGDDGTGMVEYQLGLRAIAIRNYRAGANYLAAAERRGFRAPTVLPLRTYALCMSGQLDSARQLAAGAVANSDDERRFWEWMTRQFGVDPQRQG